MSQSDVAISIRGLSKAYTIRHDGLKRPSFREVVVDKLCHPFRKANQETFWALKDVSFDVQKGDVVGIIGRNGAGKSTLLKVLSRIVEPTKGAVDIYGRVGSLLEVGTGFHPELTGRENIYLNGAILGMRREEIKREFDAIVEFAEVERFLDTPVKRYSSGMYVRLAFAVAAHLNPEILIVDEVLAVGDSEFQKKCLGKMNDVSSQQGRTILFVSHSMAALQRLCRKGILFAHGKIQAAGSISDVISQYMSSGNCDDSYMSSKLTGRPQVLSAKILTEGPRTNTAIRVAVEWTLPDDTRGVKIGIGFSTPTGQRIFDCPPEDLGIRSPEKKGHHKAVITVPPNTLLAKRYSIGFGIWKDSTVYDLCDPALSITVEAAAVGPYSHEKQRDGLVNVPCEWDILQ